MAKSKQKKQNRNFYKKHTNITFLNMKNKPTPKTKLGRNKNELPTKRIARRVDPRIYEKCIDYIASQVKLIKSQKTPIE